MSVEQELKRTNDSLNQLIPSIAGMQAELGKLRDQVGSVDKKVAVLEERVGQVREIGKATGERLEDGNEVFQAVINDQVKMINDIAELKRTRRGVGKKIWEIVIILFTIIATVLLTDLMRSKGGADNVRPKTESPSR